MPHYHTMKSESPSVMLRQMADAFDQGQNFQLTNVHMDVGLQFGDRTLHFDLQFVSAPQRKKFMNWFKEQYDG